MHRRDTIWLKQHAHEKKKKSQVIPDDKEEAYWRPAIVDLKAVTHALGAIQRTTHNAPALLCEKNQEYSRSEYNMDAITLQERGARIPNDLVRC
jgi:hypothetical protein